MVTFIAFGGLWLPDSVELSHQRSMIIAVRHKNGTVIREDRDVEGR